MSKFLHLPEKEAGNCAETPISEEAADIVAVVGCPKRAAPPTIGTCRAYGGSMAPHSVC